MAYTKGLLYRKSSKVGGYERTGALGAKCRLSGGEHEYGCGVKS